VLEVVAPPLKRIKNGHNYPQWHIRGGRYHP